MLHANGRARLSAALVTHRGDAIDRLFLAQPPAADPPPPDSPLFPTKQMAAPTHLRAASLAPRAAPRTRVSLRLDPEQLWRLRLAAAYLRQSCQAFLADAFDRHVARLAGDPAHPVLGALLGARVPNG